MRWPARSVVAGTDHVALRGCCDREPGGSSDQTNDGRTVMDVWIDNQNWTEELWFACAAVVALVILLYSIFRTHFWR
jgi:hypothetical protein